jgi:hypothetical protein
MRCPQCKEESKKSVVYPGLSTTTLMGWFPYYDEEGNYHNHDPNIHTTAYRCSNEHRWIIKEQLGCTTPNCTYEGNTDLTMLT